MPLPPAHPKPFNANVPEELQYICWETDHQCTWKSYSNWERLTKLHMIANDKTSQFWRGATTTGATPTDVSAKTATAAFLAIICRGGQMYHIVNSPQNHNNGTKMWKEIINFYTTKFAKKTHADHLQFFQQPDGFNMTLDQYKSKCHEVLTSLQMRTADGPTKFPEHELFKNIIVPVFRFIN